MRFDVVPYANVPWQAPGEAGQYAILRWTAPVSGMFMIQGKIVGEDWAGPTTTDFHLIYNTTKELFSANIDSYATPTTFHRAITVSSGDTLDFALGFGTNGNFYCDSSGVQFKLTQIK